MFDVTLTLSTPNLDGDDDVVYTVGGLPSKRETRKIERNLEKMIGRLGSMTDAELSTGKKQTVAGKNPTRLVAEYSISKNGKPWSGGSQWWEGVGDVERSYIAGLLHEAMVDAGHGDKRSVVRKAGRA